MKVIPRSASVARVGLLNVYPLFYSIGGLTIRLDLLRQNLALSLAAALIGVAAPIGLAFALLRGAFGSSALEAFIVGVALCSTSLGTTLVVLSTATTAGGVDFAQTRVGTVLVSAAVIDDVVGLVLVSVIHRLSGITDGNGGLGWVIGRPVLASGLMGLLTPLTAKFVLGPLFRRFAQARLARMGHVGNALLMALVLGAFLAISGYAGASVLFGSFLAGTFLSSLPGDGTLQQGTPNFLETMERYVGGAQRLVLQPLFFASIGFAIPFLDMWTGEIIWKGLVFSLLMALGKVLVGIVVPISDLLSRLSGGQKGESKMTSSWAPATLLGMAMVARGEIGLLIIQIGLNETPYLSREAFMIAIWAIVLNTILGPVSVGILLKRAGQTIGDDPQWGAQATDSSTDAESVMGSRGAAGPDKTSGA